MGLGNPGRDYEDTRHNIGFMVVDALASQLQVPWTVEKRWDCALAKLANGWLLKPLTFMNRSGEAASAVCRFFKVDPREVLAVYDDVDLPLGTVRFRLNGSAAGHNGVRSLISHLGGDNFPRLKMGITAGNERPAGDRMIDHVLGKFSDDEKPQVQSVIRRATEAIQSAMKSGLEAAMNLYNRKEETVNPTSKIP